MRNKKDPTVIIGKYSDDEPRDDHGRWASGGGSQHQLPTSGRRVTYDTSRGSVGIEINRDGSYDIEGEKFGTSGKSAAEVRSWLSANNAKYAGAERSER